MNSILFSANPKIVTMSHAISHLNSYDQLYFEVKFPILKDQFSFPMVGFIHMSGDKVRYAAKINDIFPFSRVHYEDPHLAHKVKPRPWLMEWKENKNNIKYDKWKNALVITKIVPFEYDTYALQRANGTYIRNPPQGYIKVLPPTIWAGF
jgi:hypothetical protein